MLAAALARLGEEVQVLAAAPPHRSAPIGPSRRRYANGAAVIETALEPEDLLDLLQAIEAAFGRRRRGQPWGARVLDLDVVLWSGGCWASPGLTIPHPAFRERGFVLGPARRVAGQWRDPLTGLFLRHLHHRLTRRRPVRR